MKLNLFLPLLVAILLISCTEERIPTIYTIGDSTMSNKKPEGYPETGWCQIVDQYFVEGIKVENHARNGRSSKSFIDEGRWQTVLDSLTEGDFVFIQFGHNDEKDYDSTRYTVPFGTYSDNLKKFVNESREKGASPILFTSIVRRHFGEDGKLIDSHGDYPTAVRQVAEELNVPLVDLETLTKEWIQSLGDEPSKEMYFWLEPSDNYPEGKKDDTHLSEKGAHEIAKLAIGEIKKKEISISKHTK